MTRNKVRDHVRAAERRAAAAGGTTAHGLLQQLADDAPEPWGPTTNEAPRNTE